MSAESVGWATNRLSLGNCPAATLQNQAGDLGIELESEEALNAAFARFKELADKTRNLLMKTCTHWYPTKWAA